MARKVRGVSIEPAVMNKQDSDTVKLLTTYVYDHRAQLRATLVKEALWKNLPGAIYN